MAGKGGAGSTGRTVESAAIAQWSTGTGDVAANAAPTAADVTGDGIEDQVIQVTLTVTIDGGGEIPPTFRFTDLPADGILYSGLPGFGGVPIATGTDYVGASYWDGDWTWVLNFAPDANWSGETSFHYTVTDGAGVTSPPATATVTVTPASDAPLIDSNVHDQPDPLAPAQNVSGTISGEDGPMVAALDNGRTVIVWQQLTGAGRIFARFHDANGAPEGAAFEIGGGTGSRVNPSVAGRPDGSFMVTWVQGGTGTGGGDVRLAVYAPGSSSPTSSSIIAASSTGREADPTLTAVGDGFVLTWAVESADGADHHAVRLSATGAVLGAPFLVSTGGQPGDFTGTTFDPAPHAVAAVGSDGAFVVVTTQTDPFATTVRAVLVGADGSVGPVIPIMSDSILPSVAGLAQGGFVVVWTADLGGLGNDDVLARIFDAGGAPTGAAFPIAATNLAELSPKVAALPDGRFVVAWLGSGLDGTRDVFTQIFTADGVPSSGGPVAVTRTGNANPEPFGFPQMIEELQPTIAVRSDGVVTIGWMQTRATGGTNTDVFLRHYDPGIGILHGTAGTPIDLPTVIDLVDDDGSEILTGVRIGGLPAGFGLAAGAREGGAADGDWIIDRATTAGADLLDALADGSGTLTILTPIDFTGELLLEIQASSQELGGLEPAALSEAGLVPMVIEPPLPQDVNTAPVQNANAGLTLAEGATATITSAMLDYDDAEQADGAITYTMTTAATNGSVRLNGNPIAPGGTFTQADLNANIVAFQHDGSETTSAGFTFSVSDGAGGTLAGQSFAIAVNPVNDAPVNSFPTAVVGVEDNPNFLNGGVFVDPGPIWVSDSDSPSITMHLIVIDGMLTVSGGGATVSGNGTNDLTLSGTPSAVNQTLLSLAYQAPPDVFGTRVVTVTTSDGSLSDTDAISWTIVNLTDPPSGADSTVATDEDVPLPLGLGNFGFSDVDGDGLVAVKLITVPGHGQLLNMAGNGGVFVDGGPPPMPVVLQAGDVIDVVLLSGGWIRYVPAADHNGPDGFQFAVMDSGSSPSNQDPTPNTLSISIAPVNDAPTLVATGASHIFTENGAALSFVDGVTVSDVDNSRFPGGTLTISASDGQPDDGLTILGTLGLDFNASAGTVEYNGRLIANLVAPGQLSLTNNADAEAAALLIRSLAYTNGSDDPTDGTRHVAIVFTDGGGTANGGQDSATINATLTVHAVNDAPSGSDFTVIGSEDDPYVFQLSDFTSGFSDPEGHGFAGIVVNSLPGEGRFTAVGSPIQPGDFVPANVIAIGQLIYWPDPDEYGDPYAGFQFSVRDNGGALYGGIDVDQSPNTVTIVIEPDNLPPVAGNDAFSLNEDTTLNVTGAGVIINDSDDGAPPPAQFTAGAILVSGPAHAASFTFNSDGTFTYTPVANYNGTDSFTYKLNDTQFDSNVATVILNITAANDAPTGTGESYNVVEDTDLTVGGPGVLNNDGDIDGNGLTAQLVTGPAHALSFTLNADGSFSYTPAADYVGPDSFTYRPFDGTAQGNLVTVDLDVIAADDAATARNDAFAISESAILAGNVFANNGSGTDSDPDSALVVGSVNGSAGNVGDTITLASGATVRLNADGTFVYDPSGRFSTLTSVPTGAANTSAQDGFSYGLAGGGTATVTIHVNGLRTTADILMGSAGNDRITDASFNFADSFMLQQGGNDSATGLGGNDGFYFGAALDGLDNVDGGSGTDSVALQGNYPALVLGNIVNVENLVPLAGNNTAFGDLAGNFYDYNITTSDVNVAAGATLSVIGGNLRAGEDLLFNGGAETDGMFRIFAGMGNDALTGGAKNDGFFFGADGNLTGLDIVNGGGGIDSIALRGNYVGATAVAFTPTSMTGVETLVFLSGHTNEFGGAVNLAGFDYDVTMADANTAAGQRMEVAAGNLRANESLRFDGRLEADGTFRVLSGAGDDNLYGGAGNDTLYGALGADLLDGGAGADTYLYRFATESTAASRDVLLWGVGDRLDLSLIDANANTAANDAFTFIAGDAFSGTAGELRVTTTGPNGIIEGDVDGDGLADLIIFVSGHVPIAGDFSL